MKDKEMLIKNGLEILYLINVIILNYSLMKSIFFSKNI